MDSVHAFLSGLWIYATPSIAGWIISLFIDTEVLQFFSSVWFGFGQQRNIILLPGSAENIMGMIDDLYRR